MTKKTRKGCVRHIMGRVGDDGKLMAVIVTATAELPCEREWIQEMREALPEMISLYHNVQSRPGNVILGPKIRCLWGAKTLPCSLCGLRFEVSPYSFFQVNPEQAEVLYRTALDFAELTGEETVIDAYCGTGTISLCLARKARRVIGIEIVPDAIRDAKKMQRPTASAMRNFTPPTRESSCRSSTRKGSHRTSSCATRSAPDAARTCSAPRRA